MEYQLIVQQAKIESEALGHVTRALEVAIAWVVEGRDQSRKVSTVRFATEQFQRQVERMFALERLDRYMDLVCRLQPEWTDQVKDLRGEHEQCRAALQQIALRLELAMPIDRVQIDALCDELHGVIERMSRYRHRKGELLVQSLNQDTGGEG